MSMKTKEQTHKQRQDQSAFLPLTSSLAAAAAAAAATARCSADGGL